MPACFYKRSEWACAKIQAMTARIAIHGEGIAACCCTMLLREQGRTLGPAQERRPRLPAVLISDGTQALLCEVFQNEKLFEGLPKIRKRVVAWNGVGGGTFPPFSGVVAGHGVSGGFTSRLPPS